MNIVMERNTVLRIVGEKIARLERAIAPLKTRYEEKVRKYEGLHFISLMWIDHPRWSDEGFSLVMNRSEIEALKQKLRALQSHTENTVTLSDREYAWFIEGDSK